MKMNHYNKRNTKITPIQREIMLTFMEAHPDFTRNKTSSVQERNNLWEELASQLNTHCIGPAKDAERWKKSWVDWKCLVKSKCARGVTSSCPPDGGGEYLSPLELRLLQLVDWKGLQEGDVIPQEPVNDEQLGLDEVEQKVFPSSVLAASDSVSRLEDDFGESYEEQPVIEASTQTTNRPKLGTWTNWPQYQRNRSLRRAFARIPHLPFRRSSRCTASHSRPTESSGEVSRLALERIASAQERMASAEERKVTAQERTAAAAERKATAGERMASAEERKATSLEGVLSLVAEFVKR